MSGVKIGHHKQDCREILLLGPKLIQSICTVHCLKKLNDQLLQEKYVKSISEYTDLIMFDFVETVCQDYFD